MNDDGIDLGKLIDETRKLAAENAQFCEIHTTQNREIKKLKDEKQQLVASNQHLTTKVKHLHAKLDGGEDAVSQLRAQEQQMMEKVRSGQEDSLIEKRRREQAEAKVEDLLRQKEEMESRLKLSRTEIQALRNQNSSLVTERETLEARLINMDDQQSRRDKHNRTLCAELEHATASRNETTDNLTTTKLELSAACEKLELALGEVEQQKTVMVDIGRLADRLKKSECLAAERHAEITNLEAKIRSTGLAMKDLTSEIELINVQRDDYLKKCSAKDQELQKLRQLVSFEQETNDGIRQKHEKREEKITKELEELKDFRKEDLLRYQREESKFRENSEEVRTKMDKTITDQEITIKNTELELQEMLSLNQRKDAQLTDQFKKIEDLMELNAKHELTLIALKNHSSELERKYKSLDADRSKLQANLDKVNLESNSKSTDISLNQDRIKNLERMKAHVDSKLESAEKNMEKLSRHKRKTEQALSHLTAEQANSITLASQLTRKHEMELNSKDEDHRQECLRQKNEHETINADLDLLRTEWQKRAKNAEANLIKTVRRCEKTERDLEQSTRQLDEMAKYEANMQLEHLNKINNQQEQLVEQRNVLCNQWNNFERMKKFIRNTVLELNKRNLSKTERWQKASRILRFRKAVIAVLALNRLKNHSQKPDDSFSYPLDSRLANELRSGLIRVLTRTDAVQLYSTKLLAGNINQGIQTLLDKNVRLEREKSSLREKLKSSTSFMSELEERVKSIEAK